MTHYIWLNGSFIDEKEANVPILTHGLHYGSSVFEGIRAYNGKIFKSREHSERLFYSAKMLDIALDYTPEDLEKAMEDLLKKNNHVDCYIRPVAWMGGTNGGSTLSVGSKSCHASLAIATWVWKSYHLKEGDQGIRLCWSSWRRPDPLAAPCHAKAAGLYMICTLSVNAAHAKGYQDALMLDYRGYVAECSSANIFFIRENEIHTPIADCFLNGITRQTVMDLAHKRNYNVIERHILPKEIPEFDEIFITGTAAEITSVLAIEEHSFRIGEITSTLQKDYWNLVRS